MLPPTWFNSQMVDVRFVFPCRLVSDYKCRQTVWNVEYLARCELFCLRLLDWVPPLWPQADVVDGRCKKNDSTRGI